MKKWMKASVGSFAIIGMLAAGSTISAAPKAALEVFIDGQLQQDVLTVNGRTMAQLIDFNDPANFQYTYEQSTKTVVVNNTAKKVTVRLKAGDTTAQVNGKSVKLDAPVTIKNGRTYLPLRFLSETLGGTVAYNTDTKHVIVRTPSGEERFKILMSGDLVAARAIAISSGRIYENKEISPYGEGFRMSYTFPKGEALRYETLYRGLTSYIVISSEGLPFVKYEKDNLGHNGEAGIKPASFSEAVYFEEDILAEYIQYGTIDNKGVQTQIGEITYPDSKKYFETDVTIFPIDGEVRTDAKK